MKPTGIKLEGDELATVLRAAEAARNAPVIGYGGNPTMADYARRDANEVVQKLAVIHGLPDGSFYYSFSNENEFLVPDGFEAEYDRLRTPQ